MANVNAPRGFKPVKLVTNEPYNGGYATYRIASGYASNIFSGDVVKMITSGYINVAAPGDQMRGVAVGFRWINAAGSPVVFPFWPAGTVTLAGQDAQVFVIDDPNMVFEAVLGNSTSAPAISNIGKTYQSYTGSGGGSLGSGLSAEGADFTTLATSAQQWRLLDFVQRVDNDPTSAYSRGLFTPALHDLRVNTGI